MAKITRKTQKIFGGNSNQNGQFGSARAGTFVLDNDPDVIQALPSWESGINAATISGEKLPALEENQGIHFVETRQLAYILQEGIAEYDPNTEYHQHSLVKEVGGARIYRSLTSPNTGNPLSSTGNWMLVLNLSNPTILPLNNYTATTNPTTSNDQTQGYSAGSYWYNTVSGDTYFCTTAATGAANWILQTAISPDDLGTAAFENVGFFATAAQGAKADTAIQRNEPVITANTGASYSMNYANAQNFTLTMTANCTLNITNPPTDGGAVVLKLIQDGTGNRTPTFGITIDNDLPTIPSGAGDYILLVLSTLNGGTNWIVSEVATVE